MDLKKIKSHCQQNSEMFEKVLNDFLLPYAAQSNRLGKEMNRQFDRFRHITKNLPANFLPMAQAQFLIHAVFKQDGAIRKYLNHADFKILSDKKRQFLEFQSAHTWQFSFAQIIESLGDDFYQMLDVFSGEMYLLYSPGIGETLQDYSYQLWFILTCYNGECYQAYGPLHGYLSFTPDDIFFFANELNADVESDEDLRRAVEKNPVPFMMLVSGAAIPPMVAKGENEMMYVFSELLIPNISEFPADVFEADEHMGVVKLTLAGVNDPPHFATAYYDRKENLLQLTALTIHGHELLVRAFKKLSINFDEWPDLTISLAIKSVTEQILKREIDIFPYMSMFSEEPDPDEEDIFSGINLAMQEILPIINRGEYPDIEALAKIYEVDEDMLRSFVDHTLDRLKNF